MATLNANRDDGCASDVAYSADENCRGGDQNREWTPKALPENSSTAVLLDEAATLTDSVRSAPEAERRQLTVMFCDLVGSTD